MAVLIFVGALSFVLVAVWRGRIYDFPAGAWAIAAAVALVGVVLSYIAGLGRQRQPGELTLLAIPFLAEIFRKQVGVTPEASVPLLLFSAGSYLVIFHRLTVNRASRKHAARRWFAEIGALDPHVREELNAYFCARGELEGRLEQPRRNLAHAFGKMSRRPGPSWLAAADALRTFEAAAVGWLKECEALPIPDCLREKDRESTAATHELLRECRRLAESLESGQLERMGYQAANRRVVEAAREWQYAIGELARHHRVSVPRWFLKQNCQLQRAR